MCGEGPDFAKRDPWQHFENGWDVRWTMFVQVLTPAMLASGEPDFDPFNLTKVGPGVRSRCTSLGSWFVIGILR